MAEYLTIPAQEFVLTAVEEFDTHIFDEEAWTPLTKTQLRRLDDGLNSLWLRGENGRFKKFNLMDHDRTSGVRLYTDTSGLEQAIVRKEIRPLAMLVLQMHASIVGDQLVFSGHLLSGLQILSVQYSVSQKVSMRALSEGMAQTAFNMGLTHRRNQLSMLRSKNGGVLTQLHGLAWTPKFAKHSIKPQRRLTRKVSAGMLLLRRHFVAV